MINRDTLERLEALGFGADVDSLENYVESLQDAAGIGKPIVTDAEYDGFVRLLREVKPESKILGRNWEVADFEYTAHDELLKKYGMTSILTIQSYSELGNFKNTLKSIGHPVELVASLKENGHGCRCVYEYGNLVEGTTRGRYKRGRDILKHFKATVPNFVEIWKDIPMIEVRGEFLVKVSVFEEKLQGTGLKTPLSAVTSLIRESVTDRELECMSFVAYKILAGTKDNGELLYSSLEQEFDALENAGFETPTALKVEDITEENLIPTVDKILKIFEKKMDDGLIDYYCDGIVFCINDSKTFYETGMEGNTRNGNFALKVGRYWASNVYESEIEDIQFVPGKSYIIPKALVRPVKTSSGAVVDTVPLYNVGIMNKERLIPGEKIYFRFGGESGVTLCDAMGNRLTAN